MADIPQEVREAAAKLAAVSELRPILLSGEADDHLYIEVCHAMFLAGKRAGMEHAAEIVDGSYRMWGEPRCCAAKDIAKEIRSEADGHG